jgi:polysaccharide pyruvyl transferase WcaK-like protein/MoaA/NifB/PqqE/SkfB family radical SAM enzyme
MWRGEIHMLALPDLQKLLSNRLMKDIRTVGISGGEPFLRTDLVDAIKNVVETLPRLRSVSINSNGIDTESIRKQLPMIAEVCNHSRVALTIYFSIDGIGPLHDEIRGVKEAFAKVLASIRFARTVKNCVVRSCATISRKNLYQLSDLMYFFTEEGLAPEFRVAVPINRLNNIGMIDNFSFNTAERYELYEFFWNLSYDSHNSIERNIFYRNLALSLLSGLRTSECRFMNEGIFLDCDGQIYQCAVRGHALGNARLADVRDLYFSKESQSLRRTMINGDCMTCHHDYSIRLPARKILSFAVESRKGRVIKNLICGGTGLLKSRLSDAGRHSEIKRTSHAFITGWYGTETTGDKAILLGIILLLQTAGYVKFFIHSSNTEYTSKTLFELGVDKACEVVSFDYALMEKAIEQSDTVIFGGGPFGDYSDIFYVQLAVEMAKRRDKNVMVLGCGMGPMRRMIFKESLKAILKRSNLIIMRDTASVKQIKQLIKRGPLTISICDPALFAFDVFEETKEACINIPDMNCDHITIGVCLREWTYEYASNLNKSNFVNAREKYFLELKAFLEDQALKNRLNFIPMNTFAVGYDDREFIHQLFSASDVIKNSANVSAFTCSASFRAVVGEFRKCALILAMRYHSVVFAVALGIPFIAIDYKSGGGKVSYFLRDLGLHDLCVMIDDMDKTGLSNKYRYVMNHADDIRLRITVAREKERLKRDQFVKCIKSMNRADNYAG